MRSLLVRPGSEGDLDFEESRREQNYRGDLVAYAKSVFCPESFRVLSQTARSSADSIAISCYPLTVSFF